MPFIFSNNRYNPKLLDKSFGQLNSRRIGDFLFTYDGEKKHRLFEDDKKIILLYGVIYDLNISHLKSVKFHVNSIFKNLKFKWPFSFNISGSYSIFIYDKINDEIIIMNDQIGIYPIYYKTHENKIIISSNISMVSLTHNVEEDKTGIFQRLYCTEMSNIGSRTIVKNLKRLLPGELIRLNVNKKSSLKFFDNSLFNSLNNSKSSLKKISNEYWINFKRELKYINKSEDLYLALSGGMDSRILLSGIDRSNKLTCLTYGSEKNYEVKIAKRLSERIGLKFHSFYDSSVYQPDLDTMKKYTYKTESMGVISWLEILESEKIKSIKNYPILLYGDMCEALPGRNIGNFNKRINRIKNFIFKTFLNRPYNFTEINNYNLIEWKKRIIRNEIERFPNEISGANLKKIEIETTKDINQLIDRILCHNIQYTELLDELYKWYTHGRVPMGKQVNLSQSLFKPICPGMTSNILRFCSNIHPNNRIDYRLINNMTKTIPDIAIFNDIPIVQSPFINLNFPNYLRLLTWGLRSLIDQFLIWRMMKKRNPELRYRLLNSTNWPKIYQYKYILKNFDECLKKTCFDEKIVNKFRKLLINRKKLKSWPMTNYDIISFCSLNLELNLINKKNESKE